MRRIPTVCLAMASLLLVASHATAGQTSVVLDPIGEFPFTCGKDDPESCPGQGFTVPLFQDIVRAEVSKKSNVFSFVMDVADEIPASPSLDSSGIKLLEWSFRLDLDPTTFTSGFPFSKAPLGDFADIMVFVLWDGASFTASVIDRRPSLEGLEAVVAPVPFDIKLNRITVSVDAAMIGDPPNFLWRAFTEVWKGQLGTDSWSPLDIAPSGSHVFASWPDALTSTGALVDAYAKATSGKLCLTSDDCNNSYYCDLSTCQPPPSGCSLDSTCSLCWGKCVNLSSECKPRCRF
jgi:hypothetical protein